LLITTTSEGGCVPPRSLNSSPRPVFSSMPRVKRKGLAIRPKTPTRKPSSMAFDKGDIRGNYPASFLIQPNKKPPPLLPTRKRQKRLGKKGVSQPSHTGRAKSGYSVYSDPQSTLP